MIETGPAGRPTPYECRVRAAADVVRVMVSLAALVVLAFGHVEAGITLGLVAVTTIAVRFAGASATIELAFVAMASVDAALNAAGPSGPSTTPTDSGISCCPRPSRRSCGRRSSVPES